MRRRSAVIIAALLTAAGVGALLQGRHVHAADIAVTQVASHTVTSLATGVDAVEVSCPTGTAVTGGGFSMVNGNRSASVAYVLNSYPVISASQDKWHIDVDNSGGVVTSATAYAVCGF